MKIIKKQDDAVLQMINYSRWNCKSQQKFKATLSNLKASDNEMKSFSGKP